MLMTFAFEHQGFHVLRFGHALLVVFARRLYCFENLWCCVEATCISFKALGERKNVPDAINVVYHQLSPFIKVLEVLSEATLHICIFPEDKQCLH